MTLGVTNIKKEAQEELRKQIEEFLAKGGQIKTYSPEVRTRREEGIKRDQTT